VSFAGSGATLALKAPATFAATIGGFALTDAIDLIGLAATGAVLGRGDRLVITNGVAVVATLQLSGDYTGDSFATSSDGHGGTSITINGGAVPWAEPPKPHAFVAAAASLGADAGFTHPEAAGALAETWRPTFAAPKPMLA
jgi:hypothetical protein